MGPSTILTAEEEQHLVHWILHMSEKGFPITKDQLLDSVQLLVQKMERETPFTNDRPGRRWWESFRRRHPELSQRVAQNLTYTRASVTEGKLKNWFQEISSYLETKGLLNIDPSRVFNCDESGFMLCPKADNVIVRKGAKRVYKIVNADEKESITTLFMVNGAGIVVPPMIMYWYERIPKAVSEKVPSNWSIGKSERGWMTAETFFEYISNCFYRWLKDNNIEFAIVLFVDGHSSHCTLPLSNFCREKNIELIALYPNATHILQPLDVAVFHPLKNAWKKTVNEWRLKNDGSRLKKEDFAPLLKLALDSLNLTDTIKNGFRSCGLAPFSADAVDFNVLKKGMSSERDLHEVATSTIQVETKYDEALKLMEQQLPTHVISAFEESYRSGVWIGETSDEGLFQYWKKIRTLAANNGHSNIQSNATEEHDGDEGNDGVDSQLQQGDTIVLPLDMNSFIVPALSEAIVNHENIGEALGGIIDLETVEQRSIEFSFSENIEEIDEFTMGLYEINNNTEDGIENLEEKVQKIVDMPDSNLQNGSNVSDTPLKPIDVNKLSTNVKDGGETTKDCGDRSVITVVHRTPKETVKEIPSIFKETLFWPDDKKKEIKKKKTTQKLPSVATSDEWHQLALQKEEEKTRILPEKEERRIKRAEMQEQKKITQLQKQRLQEEKKRQQEEKKRQQEEKKRQQEEKKKLQQEKKKQQQENKKKQQEMRMKKNENVESEDETDE